MPLVALLAGAAFAGAFAGALTGALTGALVTGLGFVFGCGFGGIGTVGKRVEIEECGVKSEFDVGAEDVCWSAMSRVCLRSKKLEGGIDVDVRRKRFESLERAKACDIQLCVWWWRGTGTTADVILVC